MKILFVIKNFSFGGGVESILSNWSIELGKRNIDHDILTIIKDEDAKKGRQKMDWPNSARKLIHLDNSCNTSMPNKSGISWLIYTITRKRQIQKYSKQITRVRQGTSYDYVISLGYDANASLLFSKGKGKAIVSVHTWRGAYGIVRRWLYYPFNRCNGIFTVSEGIEKEIKDSYKLRIPITTVYNGIDDKKILKRETGRGNDILKFVSVGRLSDQKAQWNMIKALSKLPKDYRYTLDIYGGGPLKDKLNELIKQHNLEDNVFLKGESDKINEILKDYDVFLFTSRFEGFALALEEAIAANLKLVTLDFPHGPKEIMFGEVFDDTCNFKIRKSELGYLVKAAKNDSIDNLNPENEEIYNLLAQAIMSDFDFEKENEFRFTIQRNVDEILHFIKAL